MTAYHACTPLTDHARALLASLKDNSSENLCVAYAADTPYSRDNLTVSEFWKKYSDEFYDELFYYCELVITDAYENDAWAELDISVVAAYRELKDNLPGEWSDSVIYASHVSPLALDLTEFELDSDQPELGEELDSIVDTIESHLEYNAGFESDYRYTVENEFLDRWVENNLEFDIKYELDGYRHSHIIDRLWDIDADDLKNEFYSILANDQSGEFQFDWEYENAVWSKAAWRALTVKLLWRVYQLTDRNAE